MTGLDAGSQQLALGVVFRTTSRANARRQIPVDSRKYVDPIPAKPADGETNWGPYQHGAETVSFDPFYLVWASTDDSIDLDTGALPWPFQLTEIRRFGRESYFAPARPPTEADDALREGCAIYTAHCGKCHRMRGVGGDVGPVLDREGSCCRFSPRRS